MEVTFVRYLINQTDKVIVSYDALTYAGNLSNIHDLPTNQHAFVHGNICDKEPLRNTLKKYNIKTIVHFAAESHVDRSIMSSDPFVQTNIVGTQCLLDASKAHGIERFIHISTDEVYGTLKKMMLHLLKRIKSSQIVRMPHPRPPPIYW